MKKYVRICVDFVLREGALYLYLCMDPKRKRTRSTPDPDIDFPPKDVASWNSSGHLPNFLEVIGAVKYLVDQNSRSGRCAISSKKCALIISEKLVKHWSDRNIYPKHVTNVAKSVSKDYEEYLRLRKLMRKTDRPISNTTLEQYGEILQKRQKTYDIYGNDSLTTHKFNKEQMKKHRENWEKETGVTMSSREFEYLESQRDDKIPRQDKIKCFPKEMNVDPAWQKQQDRLKKRAEYEQKQREEMSHFNTQGTYKSEESDDGGSDEGDDDDFTPMCVEEKVGTSHSVDDETTTCRKRKRRAYSSCKPKSGDPLPDEMRWARYSERNIREEIYLALSDLIGIGLSVKEALQAVMIVSNRCFDREFHLSNDASDTKEDESLEPIDQNTLPNERSVREMIERVEAQGLAAEAREILTRSKEGNILTHASDSTTKRDVGKFCVSGIHINKEKALPLPTVPVKGEERDEIAQQAALGFEILAAAMDPPIDAAELYRCIDLHLTDSTSHNKYLSEDVPKLFDLNHKPGQIFCSTHTGLGFCASMNDSISEVERKHGINTILDGFVIEIEYESKNGSLVGQFVDCMTRLVGMELKHKPWNRGEEFKKYCNEVGAKYLMFLYKDERFGCFPKACGVCLYSREVLQDFLQSHPHIDNRLACLVRDIYGQEYVKLCMAVVASFGIHLLEPFHATTISPSSNHNTLKDFFQEVHDKMGEKITDEFFTFSSPWYPGISQRLFDDVKEGYGKEVVEAIVEVTREYPLEAVKLANHFQPSLQITLARQRRDYNLSDMFPPEHPIDEISNKARVNSPTHNLGMESSCGLVGHRTKKNRQLDATSRSIIIDGTKALREKYGGSFKDFRQAAKRVKGKTLGSLNISVLVQIFHILG